MSSRRRMEIFPKKRFTLVVSLPFHSVELAEAAERGGAHALKVHLNVHHAASGTRFGSWKKEKSIILEILKSVSIPVGVMPGSKVVASEKDLGEMEKSGISFFDIYLNDCPSYLLRSRMKKMLALGYGFNLETLTKISYADWVEASVVGVSDYGKSLTAQDILLYKTIVQKTNQKVFVPTQKKISPDDVTLLHRAGVSGIIIGSVVTGKTPKSMYEATRNFKKAIHLLASQEF